MSRLASALVSALALIGLVLVLSGPWQGIGTSTLAPGALVGQAQVIDADSLRIGDISIRLHGIDAPEGRQTCLDSGGASWACGTWATAQLRELIGTRPLACHVLDTDRYGRTIARCTLGEQDLNAMIVAAGLAFAYRAYSTDYVPQETAARAARIGIWQGQVEPPWEYRANLRRGTEPEIAASDGPGDCLIKGNISASGHIYHMPGDRDYARTRIDTSAGERWFCTRAQAEAAGWRAARR